MAGYNRRGPRERGSSRRFFPPKRKVCRFCEDGIVYIDFKDTDILSRYVTEKGRILPRRITGVCGTCQKKLSRAIKRSRNAALMR